MVQVSQSCRQSSPSMAGSVAGNSDVEVGAFVNVGVALEEAFSVGFSTTVVEGSFAIEDDEGSGASEGAVEGFELTAVEERLRTTALMKDDIFSSCE